MEVNKKRASVRNINGERTHKAAFHPLPTPKKSHRKGTAIFAWGGGGGGIGIRKEGYKTKKKQKKEDHKRLLGFPQFHSTKAKESLGPT